MYKQKIEELEVGDLVRVQFGDSFNKAKVVKIENGKAILSLKGIMRGGVVILGDGHYYDRAWYYYKPWYKRLYSSLIN